MKSLELKIDGMSCGHCLARVEKALKKVDGVAVGPVRIGYAQLFYDPAKGTAAAVLAALDEAGYSARILEPSAVPA